MDRCAAPLERSGPVVLVDHVMLERRQEKRSEAATLRIGGVNRAALQEQGEEALRQVFGVLCGVATAAQEDIERVPVSVTENRQRLAGIRR